MNDDNDSLAKNRKKNMALGKKSFCVQYSNLLKKCGFSLW